MFWGILRGFQCIDFFPSYMSSIPWYRPSICPWITGYLKDDRKNDRQLVPFSSKTSDLHHSLTLPFLQLYLNHQVYYKTNIIFPYFLTIIYIFHRLKHVVIDNYYYVTFTNIKGYNWIQTPDYANINEWDHYFLIPRHLNSCLKTNYETQRQ